MADLPTSSAVTFFLLGAQHKEAEQSTGCVIVVGLLETLEAEKQNDFPIYKCCAACLLETLEAVKLG